jgi:hypothetical protein
LKFQAQQALQVEMLLIVPAKRARVKKMNYKVDCAECRAPTDQHDKPGKKGTGAQQLLHGMT